MDRSQALEDHADAMSRGARCTVCPLFGSHRGPVRSEFATQGNLRLAAVGQNPGIEEVRFGQPFVGKTGKTISKPFKEEDVPRSQVSLLNVIECSPKIDIDNSIQREKILAAVEGMAPRPSPVDCCAPRLLNDLRQSGAETILALGSLAHETIADLHGVYIGKRKKGQPRGPRVAAITQQQGHPFKLPDGRIVVSTPLPTWALYDAPHMLHTIESDIAKAIRIAKRGHVVDWKRPKAIIDPTLEQIESWIAKALERKPRIVVDIETDGIARNSKIRCVGLRAQVQGKPTIVIPLLSVTGQEMWTPQDRLRVENLLREVLSTCRLVFHNGSFDTTKLLVAGLMTDYRQQYDDTILMLHDSRFCDAPKGLSFAASRFGEAPMWKLDVDGKGGTEADDDVELWKYNAIDLQETDRAIEGLEPMVEADGCSRQYAHDTQLAPIIRDMSNAGLCIHLETKSEITEKVATRLDKVNGELRSIVGPDFNPRSGKQIATWLYKRRGLTPLINTKQKEFDEEAGDVPGTGEEALLALLDAGVGSVESDFINTLLIAKALEKLRSSFLENLKLEHDDDLALDGMSLLFSQFGLHQVASGRLNSRDPNVQNWPKLGPFNMRKMVVASPGHVFVGFDYEQLEARLFAIESGDEIMLDAFRRDLDVHALNWASLEAANEAELWDEYHRVVNTRKLAKGLPRDRPLTTAEIAIKLAGDKAEFLRRIAKFFLYLIQYGGEKKQLFSTFMSERDKVTNERPFKNLRREDVERWFDRMHANHPWIKNWHRKVDRTVMQRGFEDEGSEIGRRRWFPGGLAKINAPKNHRIQARGASIINEDTIQLDRKIPCGSWSKRTGLKLQCHDQLVYEVPEDRATQVAEIINRQADHMIDGIRIYGEAVISKSWADQ